MLVKVKIDDLDQVIRMDNGQIVGKKVHLGNYDYISNENGSITLRYGYISIDNCFNMLCQSTNCSYSCLSLEYPDCRYANKNFSTIGFYFEE